MSVQAAGHCCCWLCYVVKKTGMAVFNCSFQVASSVRAADVCVAQCGPAGYAARQGSRPGPAEWVGWAGEGALHCMDLPGGELIARGMGGAGSYSPKFGRVRRPQQLQHPCSTQVSTCASRIATWQSSVFEC